MPKHLFDPASTEPFKLSRSGLELFHDCPRCFYLDKRLGIGRPSTYASTMATLEDRQYVKLEKKQLIPEDKGRLVTAFLVSFFEHYVDSGFTAGMEEKLDDIAVTIRNGIRSSDPKTRLGSMPAFGREGMMKRADIETVADYVRSIAGLSVGPKADVVAGRKLFLDN